MSGESEGKDWNKAESLGREKQRKEVRDSGQEGEKEGESFFAGENCGR